MTVSQRPSDDLSNDDAVNQMYELLFGVCDLGAGEPTAYDDFVERERRIVIITAAVKLASDRQKVQLAWWSLRGFSASKLADYLSTVIGVLTPSRVQQLIEEGRMIGGIPARIKRKTTPTES